MKDIFAKPSSWIGNSIRGGFLLLVAPKKVQTSTLLSHCTRTWFLQIPREAGDNISKKKYRRIKKKRWRRNTLRQSGRRWIIYRRPFELFKRGRTAIESTARSIQFLVRCLFFFYLSLRSFDDASVRSSPTARARNRLLTKRLKGNGRGRKLADVALVGRVVFCCCLIQYKRRHSSMISHWKPSSRTNYQTTNDPYKQQGRFISSTPCGCVHRFSIFVFLAFPLLSIHKWPEHVRS